MAREREIRFKWKTLQDSRSRDIKFRRASLVLVGNDVYWTGNSGKMAVLSCRSWMWKELGSPLGEIASWQVCRLADEKIYSLWAAEEGRTPGTVVFEYDTVLGQGREVNTFAEGPERKMLMTAVFSPFLNEILTFGGKNLGSDSPVVLCNKAHALNIETLSWKELVISGRRPSGRLGHAAIMCKKKMYVFGGRDTTGNLADLWIADFANRRFPFWSLLDVDGTVPARVLPTLNHLSGMLVLYGGYGAQGGELDIFLPELNAWQDENSANIVILNQTPDSARRHHGITTSNGILYFTRTGLYMLSLEC